MSEAVARHLHRPVLAWYAEHARDLPWRRSGVSAWAVLVSEVMLQQTPVARVEPVWQRWMARWPTPADLAAEPSGEAVRAWERLGYPRRAVRLHACARIIADRHDGQVPHSSEELLALPGIGSYTAEAVSAFAFGARACVVDTNVRRVLARALTGAALPAPSVSRAETALARAALPTQDVETVRWNVAVMELGALVCSARAPSCDVCPIIDRCTWVSAGRPAYTGPARRGQPWRGTDRQCRGCLLQALREADAGLSGDALCAVWPLDDAQRERCLAALVDEGLLMRFADPLPPTQDAGPGNTPEPAIRYGFATN